MRAFLANRTKTVRRPKTTKNASLTQEPAGRAEATAVDMLHPPLLFERLRPIRHLRENRVDDPADQLFLREVDLLDSVAFLVVVGVQAAREEHRRHPLLHERPVVAALDEGVELRPVER